MTTTISTTTQTILDAVNKTYHSGEGRINQALPNGERGDGLADFMATELADVTKDESDPECAIENADSALELAIKELQDARDTLSILSPETLISR